MSQVTDTKGLSASSQARTAQGTLFYFAELGQTIDNATWTEVEGMKSGNIPVPEKAELDVTPLKATSKQFISIMGDNPDLTVDLDYYPENSVHQKMIAEMSQEGENRWWKIVIPKSITYYVFGYIKGWPVGFSVNQQLTAQLTIKTSGEPVFEMPKNGTKIAWSGTFTGDKADGDVTGELTAVLDNTKVPAIQFTDDITDGSNFAEGTHYTITNVPLGLTPVLQKVDSKNLKLTFTGQSLITETVNNITVKLLTKAFKNCLASTVEGFVKTDVTITFADTGI